ncbi:MAG: glycosyl transferase family 2 [Methylophaga sp.]|nr:MAG: glycosyl transferase family 2 [Methylophaga sp.]
MEILVGIVIVNYKTADLTIECLRSLNNERVLNCFRVIVVDNDSQDGSFQKISLAIEAEGWVDWAKVQSSGFNGGFSFGNNFAIRQFIKEKKAPEFIYLLNPDTVVMPYAIKSLVLFLLDHPKVGIVGSRLEDPDGTPQCSSFRFHTLLSELESSLRFGPISRLLSRWRIAPKIEDDTIITDWVAGASMLIRSDVFADIGLMDEDYFLYFEETDFCLQAKRKGWECWYIPSSRVVHFVGQSTGIISGNEDRPRRPSYWFEARQHYFLKNHGLFYTILADLTWGIGFLIWRLRRIIQRKPDTDPKNMLVDFWKNSIFFNLLDGKHKS